MDRTGATGLAGEHGAVAPMVALLLSGLLACAGLVTDVGVWYAARRSLQSATDAAALAAAGALGRGSDPQAAAAAILAANGFDPAQTLVSLTPGVYCPDVALAPADRFGEACEGLPASDDNAVKVVTQRESRTFLLRALGTPGSRAPVLIGATAIGAQVDQAGLEIATSMVENRDVANAVLGSLLGTTVNLQLVHYQGLARTQIDALTFLDALAIRAGATAGTYNQLLSTTMSAQDVLDVAADVLAEQQQTADVAAAIAGLDALKAAVPGATQVSPSSLFDLGMWGDTPVGGSAAKSALRAGINVQQLATATVQLADGDHAVTIPASSLNVSGLASLAIESTVIEPPQRARFAFGQEGLSVHSAQVRLKLNLQLVGSLVNVPLYVEVGSGDAELGEIRCSGDVANDAQVDVINARSAAAAIYIADVPDGLVENFSQPVPYASMNPAMLSNLLGLVTISIKAKASLESEGASVLTFAQPGAPEMDGVIGAPPWGQELGIQGKAARISSAIPLASLLTGLLGSMGLKACVLGICTSASGLQVTAVTNLLTPVLSTLDEPLSQILSALGTDIGNMDVAVTGLKCGFPVVVY